MDENKKLTLIIDMMKIRKILLSGCLVATLCSCGGSQNENLNLTLSKDALFDKVKGERFEYETNMLLEFKQSHIDFVEVQIETVYIEENASTHFNPIKDSLKIYGVIFKFLFSSIASSVIDLAMFALISALMFGKLDGSIRIFTATLGARIISSLFNYTFNRKAVFNSKSGVKSSIVRYYILCACQLCVSYGLVYLVTSVLSLGQVLTVVAKAIIDTILFVISFQIQRRWVFKHN